MDAVRVSREWVVQRPAVLGSLALIAYALMAVAIFGRGVLLSPHDEVVGDAGADKTIFMWSFRWWPHALVDGNDPLDANVVWAPHGIDLSWVTSVPLASLLLTPLTAAAGPVVTYNAAALAAPALAAWGAYVLARWLTKAFWPSFVAGWIFGFSAYQIGHLMGHLNLVLVVFVPFCALLVLQHVHGEITDRRFVALLAVLLAAEFLTSTEVFTTVLIVGLVFGTALALVDRSMRGRLRSTLRCGALATAICLVLVSPYLWHAFVSSGIENAPQRSPYFASADVLNYLTPTRLIWLQLPGSAELAGTFTAGGAERGAYLGLPIVTVVAVFLVGLRRSRSRRVVALGLAVIVIASLGASIRVAGHDILPGPWKILAALPITRGILPIRLTMYVTLIVALVVAVWLAERDSRRRAWRWAIALLGIAFILPNPATSRWSSDVPRPIFFSSGTDSQRIPRGETVLVLPYGGAGWSLLWQAEGGFRYRLVGGHFGRATTPGERQWERVYRALSSGLFVPGGTRELRRFLVAHDVRAILVAPGAKSGSRRLVGALGVEPVRADDVLLYSLADTASTTRLPDRSPQGTRIRAPCGATPRSSSPSRCSSGRRSPSVSPSG